MTEQDNIELELSEESNWGGNWTQDKIEIFIKYLQAYLQIMKNTKFKLIYFDGFAGSGEINPVAGNHSFIESVALQVLAIDNPKSFDMYYLVELHDEKIENLKNIIKSKFPNKQVFCANADCNVKLQGLQDYLQKHKNYRALAFVDPFGMEVSWASLNGFKELGCDMWILVPSGIGVNRMLKRDGNISQAWIKKLENFLGLTEKEIKEQFYKEKSVQTLFGDDIIIKKQPNATDKIIELYSQQLRKIWKHVSKPYPMRNKNKSIMFHFICASQNSTAIKIASQIIDKVK